VKIVLAILFGVALVTTPFVAPAAMPCAKTLPACCQHGHVMPCCSGKNSAPQNAPVLPSQNGARQNPISTLIFSAAICVSPLNPANAISRTTVFSSNMTDAPLFARNCVRLI
jgi:hypothetical protein